MTRPLWRDLWRRHRQRQREASGGLRRPRFRRAALAVAGAVTALAVGSSIGDVRSKALHTKLIGLAAAVAFLVFAVLAIRSAASQLYALVAPRGGTTAGSAIRIISSGFGYVLAFFVTLDLLSVPIERLLVGAGITGVVVGIAAQQSLGNVFAGLVLLLARPFTVGDDIRIRSGALGGLFHGVVVEMGLTYTSLDTDEGPLKVPNGAMLAAAVGPYQSEDVAPAGGSSGPGAAGPWVTPGPVVTIGPDTPPDPGVTSGAGPA